MTNRPFVIVLVLAMSAGLSLAGGGSKRVHGHDAKHGGVVVHSGDHNLELVVDGANIELYVSGDEGNVEEMKDAKASATVVVDGKTETVALAPASGSFKGVRNSSEGKVATVVVTLSMPGHETEQVGFKLD